MIKHSTTEITSNTLRSDNPLHQRLLAAYQYAKNLVGGNLLEIGCGVGRGTELLMEAANQYTGIDKNDGLVKVLQEKYPTAKFFTANIPPLDQFEDEQFDSIVTFQVIEHIKKDDLFLQEISRLLKKGGIALVSTPNIRQSLTRNPWHVREYTAEGLESLCKPYFSAVKCMGISGNEKVAAYHEENRIAVNRITRFDILKLQYRLPAALLRVPYDILNRINRNKLDKKNESLVSEIQWQDYLLSDKPEQSLDLFYILRK